MNVDAKRLAIGACVFAFVISAASAAPVLNAEDKAKLRGGDAIIHVSEDDSGEADGVIEAAIDIAAPPERVYAVMIDCQRAPRFVAGLRSCKILKTEQDGKSDVREHRSKWLSILPETVSVFRSDYVPNREIRFERVSGDLRYLKGAWTLEPMQGGAGTRVLYEARVGIKMAVPGFMIRSALEQDVPKLLRALRAEVFRGG
jgi:ribosome-associated toxin RatA of RatAB toxin-antitoxin module